MPSDVETWRDEWRNQWATSNGLLEQIRDEQGGIMTALDDLKAAVADNTEVSGRVATLIDSLQDQVTALQTTVDNIEAQTSVDLGEVTAQIQAITNELTAAEEPNTPAEEPAPEG